MEQGYFNKMNAQLFMVQDDVMLRRIMIILLYSVRYYVKESDT